MRSARQGGIFGVAIYHLTASKGQKGTQSAKAKHAYIDRLGKYQNTDRVGGGFGHMPAWADTPADYWKAADEYERANGRLFRSYEFALPKELTQEARESLAAEFCASIANSQEGALPYSFAIHDNGENPHCHLIVSERVNDGIARTAETWFKRANKKTPEKGGAIKAESLERKERLFEIRKEWEERVNITLERAGFSARIDHRTLDQQGIKRPPQLHIGPHVLEMEARGIITRKGTEADECYREIERSEEIARIGRTDRAIGAEHGRTSGRSHKNYGHNQKHEQGSHREYASCLENSQDFSSEILSGRGFDSVDNCDSSAMRIIALAEPLRNGDIEGRNSEIEGTHETSAGIGKASEAMAGNGKRFEEHGRGKQGLTLRLGNEKDNGKGFEKADRTTEAVKNQVRAMGCAHFQIGVKNDKGMINKHYTAEEVIKAIPWLKRMNAQGNEIYIRPAADEQSALVLLDDLEPITLEEMREQGLAPAAIIETSHKNCQAWIKLGKETLTDGLRSDIAKQLAKEWGGDPASAEKRHYGRLAGFTNRKEKHLTQRGFPFVLCRSSTGEIAQKGSVLIRNAYEQEKARQIAQEAQERTQERIEAIEQTSTFRAIGGYEAPSIVFKRYMKQWRHKQDDNKQDWSKGDYAVACRMLKENYKPEAIAEAIAKHSPSIDTRKQGHGQEYAQRTLEAAKKDKDVMEELAKRERYQQAKQKQRGLGMSR